MFDPERDATERHRTFYVRILIVGGVALAAARAFLPSMIGFNAGVDADHSCVAIRDGWHADRSPNAADRVLLNEPLGQPTAQQMRVITRANARLDWALGAGACVPESRHRLIISGAALGVLASVTIAVGVTHARRRNRAGKDRKSVPLRGGSATTLVRPHATS